MSYCLPKQQVAKFLAAIRNGQIDQFALRDMSSADRRAKLGSIVGEDHAQEVNKLFEKSLLLKYKDGLDSWVRDVIKASDPQRKNILDRINSLDPKILNPKNEQSFLQDLASSRLNTSVTADEARTITKYATVANDAKADWENSLGVKVSPSDFATYTSYWKAVRDSLPAEKTSAIQARLKYGNSLLDLHDYVEELKPNSSSIVNAAVNLTTFPKTMATGLLHFSAIGVQGWGMVSRLTTWRAFGQQFKYFASEENYRNLQAYIISHPRYEFMKSGQLGLTSISDTLTTREEALQSSWAQDASAYLSDKTGIPDLIRSSSRAFTGFLNYTRAQTFIHLLDSADAIRESKGLPSIGLNDQIVKDIASVVGNFTGRGKLGPGDQFASAQPVLNGLLFAPRKDIATIQMLNPLEYGRLGYNAYKTGDTTAIKAAFRQIAGSIGVTMSVAYLAKAAGYEVNLNPTSQDFLKVIYGAEKLDITGGNAIYVRLMSRIISGQETSASGKKVTLNDSSSRYPVTRFDLAGTYIRGKLTPTVGAIVDALKDSDAVGREPTLPQELRDRMEPIWLKAGLDYYTQNPDKSLHDIPMLSAMIFGASLESPIPPVSKSGLDVWGTPVNDLTVVDHSPTPLDKEFQRLGAPYPKFPPDTINGIKLSDQQYKNYVAFSGHMATQLLTPLLSSPGWEKIPNTQKIKLMQEDIQRARKIAQAQVKAASVKDNPQDNIVTQSLKIKQAQRIK